MTAITFGARLLRCSSCTGARFCGAAAFLAWFLGCVAVYASLFGTGYLLYGRTLLGLVCTAVAVLSALILARVIPKVGFWTG